jgi:hypothetical protein
MSVQNVEFDRTWLRKVGGFDVLLGHVSLPDDEEFSVDVFGAALGGEDLARSNCGFGATEAEAVADLFRLMFTIIRTGLVTRLEDFFR